MIESQQNSQDLVLLYVGTFSKHWVSNDNLRRTRHFYASVFSVMDQFRWSACGWLGVYCS